MSVQRKSLPWKPSGNCRTPDLSRDGDAGNLPRLAHSPEKDGAEESLGPPANTYSGSGGRDNIRATEISHADYQVVVGNTLGDKTASRHRRGRKREARSLGRYPFLTRLDEYAKVLPHVVDEATAREYVRKLRYIHAILQLMRNRDEVTHTDPARFGEREVYAIDEWMNHPDRYLLKNEDRRKRQKGAFDPAYQSHLWGYLERFLVFCGNPILEMMEEQGKWKRPVVPTKAKVTKSERWFRDAMARLEGLEGWQATVVRFAVAFYWYNADRSKELRLANVEDLDLQGRVFRVQHPKGERGYGVIGATVDLFPEFLPYAVDFLAEREKYLREEHLEPRKVAVLCPTRLGEAYSENGWCSLRRKVFRQAGIEGDYRILRKSSLQNFTDALEAKGYKDGAIVELVAMRGRHSVATALENYIEVKQRRVRRAVDELASGSPEAPVVTDTSPKSLTERLRDLKQARQEGLLTGEEYETCRQRLLAGAVRA